MAECTDLTVMLHYSGCVYNGTGTNDCTGIDHSFLRDKSSLSYFGKGAYNSGRIRYNRQGKSQLFQQLIKSAAMCGRTYASQCDRGTIPPLGVEPGQIFIRAYHWHAQHIIFRRSGPLYDTDSAVLAAAQYTV